MNGQLNGFGFLLKNLIPAEVFGTIDDAAKTILELGTRTAASLAAIEARQERIENLLHRLLTDVGQPAAVVPKAPPRNGKAEPDLSDPDFFGVEGFLPGPSESVAQ